MIHHNQTNELTTWFLRSGGSELILAHWEESVTRRSSVTTSAGGEAAPERGKGGDNASWADVNLTGSKNK
jgi:hypothetical protein